MKRYAVIGSNSFTGSHIVDALLREPDNRVIAISRSPEYKDLFLPYNPRAASNLQFHQIDIVRSFDSLVELLDAVKPQVVINVAALSEVELSHCLPAQYFETNCLAVVKLCDHLRTCSYLQLYVHISSTEIFGSCDSPATEETHFNPSTPYAASKAAADMHLGTMLEKFGFPAIIVRSTNVFGTGQQLFKIIPRSVINLKSGRTIELHDGGTAARSFVHIRDLVRGVLMAIERGEPGIYHFSVPSEQRIVDIVRQICLWMGCDFDTSTRVVNERQGQDARYSLDCSRAKRELGWEPEVSFELGVREVIKWVEEEWGKIQQEPLEYVHRR